MLGANGGEDTLRVCPQVDYLTGNGRLDVLLRVATAATTPIAIRQASQRGRTNLQLELSEVVGTIASKTIEGIGT